MSRMTFRHESSAHIEYGNSPAKSVPQQVNNLLGNATPASPFAIVD